MSQFIMAGMLPRFTMPSGQTGGGGGLTGNLIFVGGATIPPDTYTETQVGRTQDFQGHIGKPAFVSASIFASTTLLPCNIILQESVDDVVWTDFAGVSIPVVAPQDNQPVQYFTIAKRYMRAVLLSDSVDLDMRVSVQLGVIT